jgi:hypothetical protein
MLAVAQTKTNILPLAAQYDSHFDEVRRVRDDFAMGFRALALGRWYVGRGGLALAHETNDHLTPAGNALRYLDEATMRFAQQGMDPWTLFAAIQRAKALVDLRDFGAAAAALNRSEDELTRFPVLASHLFEAGGQIQQMNGSACAADSFQTAILEAKRSGLDYRHELLLRHYGNLIDK